MDEALLVALVGNLLWKIWEWYANSRKPTPLTLQEYIHLKGRELTEQDVKDIINGSNRKLLSFFTEEIRRKEKREFDKQHGLGEYRKRGGNETE